MRIITGTARGTKLKSPKGLNTRPSSDRLREALFSSLGHSLIDSEVLDLFAGTGSLALEALSRGALRATMVDDSTKALLTDNMLLTKLNAKATIISADVFHAIDSLASQGKMFDLIFADPPYRQGFNERVINHIARADILKDSGLLIVEQAKDEFIITESEPKGLTLIKEKRYGIARLCFYQVLEPASE